MPNAKTLEAWLRAEAEKIQEAYGDGRGMAVRILAHKVGVTINAVNMWAAGSSPPSRKNAKRLEKVTGGAVPKGGW